MAWNHKSRIVAMAVVIQAVAGVFSTPTAADLIPVSPPTNSEEAITTEDPTATGGVWNNAPIYLGSTGSITATAPLRGPGGAAPFAANAWPLGRVLQSGGWAEVRNQAAITGASSGAGTTTTLPLAAAAPATAGMYVGFPIKFAGVGAGEIKGTSVITDYSATKVATLSDTLAAAPATATDYTIPMCVVYQLGTLSTDPPILSVSVWRDKVRYDYKDVRVSNLTIDMPVANEANQVFPSIEFTLRGLVDKIVDDTTPALPSSLLTSIPPYKNGKFTLDRTPLGHQSMRLGISTEVAGQSNSHSADGQDAYEIMSGTRTIDFDLNQMNVTDFDLRQRVVDRKVIPAVSVWGTGPGNRFAFCAPEVVLNPMNNPGDRNGFVNLTGNAGFVAVDKSATLAIWW